MRIYSVGLGTEPGSFYFLPTIHFLWADCKCFSVSLLIGNLRLALYGTCVEMIGEIKKPDTSGDKSL